MVIALDQMSGGSEVDYDGESKNEEKYVFVVHTVDIKNWKMYWWFKKLQSWVEKGRNERWLLGFGVENLCGCLCPSLRWKVGIGTSLGI